MAEMVLLFSYYYRPMLGWLVLPYNEGEEIKFPIISILWFSPSLVRPFDR